MCTFTMLHQILTRVSGRMSAYIIRSLREHQVDSKNYRCARDAFIIQVDALLKDLNNPWNLNNAFVEHVLCCATVPQKVPCMRFFLCIVI